MQNFTIPNFRIDYGWKVSEVSASSQRIIRSCDDKNLLRDNGVTLETIAQELGVTRERVRQIEAKALQKCRLWCIRHGYRLEDLLGA